MSVVIIVILFFVFGITVGIITVIAMSALRRYKWNGPSGWADPSGPDEQPPDRDAGAPEAADRSWWHTRDGD
jgi:hypothetical protein